MNTILQSFDAVRTLIVILLAISLSACHESAADDPLEAALNKAGKNRKELEKVLSHYAQDEDTLKYRAAEFLIAYMDEQSYTTSSRMRELFPYLRAMDHLNQVTSNTYFDSINEIIAQKKVRDEPVVTHDIEVITADFLIENIDQAFESWRGAPWYPQGDFETFCNYILPYKSGRAPLQSWRTMYRDSLMPFAGPVIQTGVVQNVVDTVLKKTRPRFRFIHHLSSGEDFGAADLLDIKAGQCYQWAHTSNNMMRSLGIPSALVYSPQWATHAAGHAWNAVIDSAGVPQPYAVEYKDRYRFNPLHWPLKTAKLYMQQYATNPESFGAVAKAEGRKVDDIPPYLRDPRIVDVTAIHLPVADVPVKITYDPPQKEDYVFLCVMNRDVMNAMDWSRVDQNGNAQFKHVGIDIVLFPSWYIDGKYFPAADPVNISFDGAVSMISADTSSWTTVRLYRKYPIKGSMFRYTEPFMGMKIQVATDKLFSDAVDKYEIMRYPSPVIAEEDRPRQRDRWRWIEYRDSVDFSPPLTTQYLRFKAAPNKECIIGDIECLDASGNAIPAQAFGSKDGADAVLDGVYGETYHDPDSLGWVALDFGKTVSISKIRYLPSNDSNSVQVGERYELFYWNGSWVSIGEQVAAHKWLDYKVPSGALLWLKNLDTGKEERMFTLDEYGEQVWW